MTSCECKTVDLADPRAVDKVGARGKAYAPGSAFIIRPGIGMHAHEKKERMDADAQSIERQPGCKGGVLG